jgi:glucose/arabinose dehydrogenase/cytochrome c5
MEFLDSNSLLIAEQAGRLKLLDLTSGELVDIEGLPEIPSGKGQLGLMDIALHPEFVDNRRIYFTHSVANPDGTGFATGLSTAILGDGRLESAKVLLVASPYAKSASNFGGALEFDNAGFLFFATGDKSERGKAQDKSSLKGKILRLLDDGSIPADNPFTDQSDVRPEIYALGVRNPQGLIYDAERGVMFEAEHGPMGGDEVNIVQAGANYGWPVATYGASYNTKKIGGGTTAPGTVQPLYYYLPSIAVSPITVYYGDMFPEWRGDLLVGALKGAHVSKLDVIEGAVRSDQRILGELEGRIRDIKVAADGSIYLLIQEPAGGRLHRLWRNEKLLERTTPGMRSGAAVYDMFCATCHSAGAAGAPQVNDAAEWATRLAKGRDALYESTILGYGDMPSRGFCEDCTDEELGLAVDFMLERHTVPEPKG